MCGLTSQYCYLQKKLTIGTMVEAGVVRNNHSKTINNVIYPYCAFSLWNGIKVQ